MDGAIPINDCTFYVGVNDRETDLFESIWPLPRGVSYNSYVIVDDKVAVIDTVKKIAFEPYIRKMRAAIGERGVDYLVVNHMEPDHSGSIRLLRELYPDMQILGTARTMEFLGHLYGVTDGLLPVAEGEELDLGHRRLRFHVTPMVHWPETMMTFDVTSRTLFAGDAFGGFGALDGGIFDDEVDIDYFDDEILRYFSNIVGKYCSPVQKALSKLAGVDIKVVAPTHGPVWRKNPGRIIGDYDRWSRHEGEDGVVIVYASMYGNSTHMMEAVARGLSSEGFTKVRVHDVARTDPSYIIRDLWRYKAMVLGGPTHDVKPFPPLAYLIELLADKMLKNRIMGIFGTYGWSGGCVKGLKAFAEKMDYDLVEPVVEARFAAIPDELESCHQLGQNIARRVRRHE